MLEWYNVHYILKHAQKWFTNKETASSDRGKAIPSPTAKDYFKPMCIFLERSAILSFVLKSNVYAVTRFQFWLSLYTRWDGSCEVRRLNRALQAAISVTFGKGFFFRKLPIWSMNTTGLFSAYAKLVVCWNYHDKTRLKKSMRSHCILRSFAPRDVK